MELTGNERYCDSFEHACGGVTCSLLAKQEAGIIITFFVLVAFFYSRNSAMLDPATVGSILRTMAFPCLIAMGMVQLMIAGEIDLSDRSDDEPGRGLCSKVDARTLSVPVPAAVVCSLGAALLVGSVLNGLLTVKVGIPAVITTIGDSIHRAWHQLLFLRRVFPSTPCRLR